jgi:hypothetical protein
VTSPAAPAGRGSPDGLPGTPGIFQGRPTCRLDGASCWFEVLSEGGPRIVGFGLPGGHNLLAESPDAGWDSGYGRFELLGGHRFWHAPESPECSVPDLAGLQIASLAAKSGLGLGVRLTGAVEPPTGLSKELEIYFDQSAAAVVVSHTLRNEGQHKLELSPWPVTQLRLGGTAFVALPIPVAKHAMKPTSALALWPYSGWSDSRLALKDDLLVVKGQPGPPFKIGCRSQAGAIGYLREGVLFVKRFDPAFGMRHADMGCNLEIYADQCTIELESLGPLAKLGPGDSAIHEERWELHEVGEGAAPVDLVDRFRLR